MTDHDSPPDSVYWVDAPSERDLKPEDAALSISAVSQMFGIGRFRLLCYEALGLTRRRYRVGGQRVYGWADCERIALIIKAQRAGLTLREIVPVVRAVNGTSQTAARQRGLAQCVALIDRLEKRRQSLDNAITELQYACALLAAEAAEFAKRR